MLDMHSDAFRVDPPKLHRQQQLKELKRMAAEDLRLVTEICDELASNTSTSLHTVAYFPLWDHARNTMYYSSARRYPLLWGRRQNLRLTVLQTTTKSGINFCHRVSPFHSHNFIHNDILIFVTEDGVRLRDQSNCWCGIGWKINVGARIGPSPY
ncbi:hypothetical protein T4E_7059 [Trichinella pseudospiralis]|uniref:Uncharacterized protein n=1 Tax=Trichinella pseudospiralis TaxID=6337 RepID=A0A0V0XNK7_TRIPS|nr:hypothetical protein T4E_7059 [Trichinella pseudospiralis]